MAPAKTRDLHCPKCGASLVALVELAAGSNALTEWAELIKEAQLQEIQAEQKRRKHES
jgi:hypothetical protein